jgi:hypothetical protein
VYLGDIDGGPVALRYRDEIIDAVPFPGFIVPLFVLRVSFRGSWKLEVS